MPTEIIIFIFILTCLAVAAGLVLGTYWLTCARWHTRFGRRRMKPPPQPKQKRIRLDEAVEAATRPNPEPKSAPAHEEAGRASKRASASSPTKSAKDHNQKEVLGLALSVSQRGRVRVRIVDGEGGHHLLLHSPAGYKDKARATKILERLLDARLLRVEDYEMVEEEDK